MTADIEIHGRRYQIAGPKDDSYFGHFAKHGVYTDDVTEFLRRQVRDGFVCLDIGANIGLTSIFMAACAPGVRVVAFEPSPIGFEYLRTNVERNDLRSIDPRPLALSDGPGTAEFVDLPGFIAGSHLKAAMPQHPSAQGVASTIVECTSLDRLEQERTFGRIDVLKIDAEGAELAILRGAAEVLDRYRPITIVEFNTYVLGTVQGHDPQDFLDELFRRFAEVHVIDIGSGDSRPLPNDAATRAAFVAANAAAGGVDNLACFRPLAR